MHCMRKSEVLKMCSGQVMDALIQWVIMLNMEYTPCFVIQFQSLFIISYCRYVEFYPQNLIF